MAFITKQGKVNIYECDGCGKQSFWTEEWQSYSSIALEETCPKDIPTVCSEECKGKFKERLKSGEIVLPILEREKNGIHRTVIQERKGY